MPLLLLPVLVLLVIVVLVPISIVQRYRVGTSRRRARGWVAGLNAGLVTLSAVMFLAGAAVTNLWVPRALAYGAAGLAGGLLLGWAGLALTRWEHGPRGLHYTPNRLLVLGITTVVGVRILYGFWRGWQSWGNAVEGTSWWVVAGVAESLAAGGLVLGYYAAYWAGVRRAIRRTSA